MSMLGRVEAVGGQHTASVNRDVLGSQRLERVSPAAMDGAGVRVGHIVSRVPDVRQAQCRAEVMSVSVVSRLLLRSIPQLLKQC